MHLLAFFGCPSPLLSAWPPASMSFLSSVERVDSPSRNRWETTSRVISTSLLNYVIMSSQASPTRFHIRPLISTTNNPKQPPPTQENLAAIFVSPIQCHLSTDLGGETSGTSAYDTWKLLAGLRLTWPWWILSSSLKFHQPQRSSKSSRSKNAPYIFCRISCLSNVSGFDAVGSSPWLGPLSWTTAPHAMQQALLGLENQPVLRWRPFAYVDLWYIYSYIYIYILHARSTN